MGGGGLAFEEGLGLGLALGLGLGLLFGPGPGSVELDVEDSFLGGPWWPMQSGKWSAGRGPGACSPWPWVPLKV